MLIWTYIIYIYVDMDFLMTSGCIGVFRISVICTGTPTVWEGPLQNHWILGSWMSLSGIYCVF